MQFFIEAVFWAEVLTAADCCTAVLCSTPLLLTGQQSGPTLGRNWFWALAELARVPSAPTLQTLSSPCVLQSMQAVKLRDSLEVLSDTKPFLTYKEFTDFIMQQGAADTVVEADKRADVLVEAGLVLRFNGIVYLKPREVSELVYRTLPTNPEHARRNLAQVEHELDQMDLQHKQIRKNAKRLPRFFLWTGFVVLTFQLVAFTYLTWWELSWDVMEPYGYILSLAYSCLAYLYFLLTRGGSLEFGPFEEYWTQQQAVGMVATL
eukprot:GHUV01012108.1.p1 GENE.GHUV01012108.1~~GHUV01012108.1.p1  ORF type:complete len:263 (+),score=76.49 GHUV01012108.1:1672-2460(+)